MEKLTITPGGRSLKLSPPELLDLLKPYETTRIKKSELALRFGISRVTLDFYIQNADAIRSEWAKATPAAKEEGSIPIAAVRPLVNNHASQDAMPLEDSTSAEAP